MKEEKDYYFQNIFLTLSTGIRIEATVPAFCFDNDELESLKITKIEITQPKKLPNGSKFESISGD